MMRLFLQCLMHVGMLAGVYGVLRGRTAWLIGSLVTMLCAICAALVFL